MSGTTGKRAKASEKAYKQPPDWLQAVCAYAPAHVKPAVCSCGQPIIVDHGPVWESYDPYLLADERVRVAVILQLELVRVDIAYGHWSLARTSGMYGLKPAARYVVMHRCRMPPIGRIRFDTSCLNINKHDSDDDPEWMRVTMRQVSDDP